MCFNLALLCAGAPASANITIDFVPVGNPGNAPDSITPNPGYGAVNYTFQMAKYEVTNAQYAEFLNAADPTGVNVLSLYNSEMGTDPNGGISLNLAGANGSKYQLKLNMGNKPVMWVSTYDALRFANWLNNGQGSASTETGAYTLMGATATPSNGLSVIRNPGATAFLPSEDEWYKAAYYDPAKPGGAGYWLYPTRSDTAPNSRNGSSSDANSANYYYDDGIANGFNDGYAVTNQTTYGSSDMLLTDVGAFTQAIGPYGTFDMGGNAFELNETIITPSQRGFRGGGWPSTYPLQSSTRGSLSPTTEYGYIGFRVASVIPEPASGLLMLGSGVMLLLRRHRALAL